jgi:hypothetical protein
LLRLGRALLRLALSPPCVALSPALLASRGLGIVWIDEWILRGPVVVAQAPSPPLLAR